LLSTTSTQTGRCRVFHSRKGAEKRNKKNKECLKT
jgi:hypothetical protein